MKLGATDSIKFKKLKRLLKIPYWQVVGLLESLWMFTERDAPQGDIGRYTDEDIAASIEWDGDAGDLVKALVECNWIDRSEQQRLVIHDWTDHRSCQSGLGFTDRMVPRLPPTAEEIAYLIRTNGGTYLTSPSEDFQKWWKALPEGMRSGELDCWNYWSVAIESIMMKHGLDLQCAVGHLIHRTQMFARSDKGKSEEFRWSAKTFLEAGHYDDSPKSWERKTTGERKPKVLPLNGKRHE